MAGRQRLRLVQVRKPGSFDDQKTPTQIKNEAETALATDEQAFIEYVLSQIRQILGTPDWKDPVPASLATLASRVFDVELLGLYNGSNVVFTTPEKFIPESFVLHVNGLRQQRGVDGDYTISESGGAGSGYDTVTLDSRLAPYPEESVLADYAKA